MKLRLMLPTSLVLVIAAAIFAQGYHGLGFVLILVAAFLALIAVLLPDAP